MKRMAKRRETIIHRRRTTMMPTMRRLKECLIQMYPRLHRPLHHHPHPLQSQPLLPLPRPHHLPLLPPLPLHPPLLNPSVSNPLRQRLAHPLHHRRNPFNQPNPKLRHQSNRRHNRPRMRHKERRTRQRSNNQLAERRSKRMIARLNAVYSLPVFTFSIHQPFTPKFKMCRPKVSV